MTQDIEKYVEEFYSKWTHDQLGSYADHAPAYTHLEGECTICPVQVWYQDDIAHWLRTTLETYGNARYEEGVKAERERVREWAQDYGTYTDGNLREMGRADACRQLLVVLSDNK